MKALIINKTNIQFLGSLVFNLIFHFNLYTLNSLLLQSLQNEHILWIAMKAN